MKRLHIHISVPNIEKSIAFYNALFDAQPDVVKDDYAKWMLDEPAVNFAITTGRGKKGLNHLGFQLDSDEEVSAIHERLEKAAIRGMEEKDADCCYANSNKYWTMDPAGVPWEQFHTLSTIPTFGTGVENDVQAAACGCGVIDRMKSAVSNCCA